MRKIKRGIALLSVLISLLFNTVVLATDLSDGAVEDVKTETKVETELNNSTDTVSINDTNGQQGNVNTEDSEDSEKSFSDTRADTSTEDSFSDVDASPEDKESIEEEQDIKEAGSGVALDEITQLYSSSSDFTMEGTILKKYNGVLIHRGVCLQTNGFLENII